MTTFAERLCELRNERELNQTEFGHIWGLATSTVSGYESGKIEPSRKRIEDFADFFGVWVDYLLGRSDDRGASVVREDVISFRTDGMTQADREDLAGYFEWLKEKRKRQDQEKRKDK